MSERSGKREDTPDTEPAPTITAHARSDEWVLKSNAYSQQRRGGRRMDEPAPTLVSSDIAHANTRWCFERPATTVVASFRPDVIAAPGYRGKGDGPRQDAEGSVRVTVEEAATLQSFPADYPWQGSRTKRFEQVGNAVPPGLAEAVLRAVTA